MFKTALRGAATRATVTSRTAGSLRAAGVYGSSAGKRFASSSTIGKRSWKSGALRWGVVGAGVWWYNTSDVFAEAPEAAIRRTEDSLHRIQESNLPTVDAIVEEKRARAAQRIAEDEKRQREAESRLAVQEEGASDTDEGEEGLEGLEEEADQQGAFNPETGEINWDCPCLGGMAHGPCGPEFKEAFSCFVYSKEEPKGVECIEKFKGMQDCFRQHPEMYGSELEDDEDEVEEELRARESAKEGEALTSAPAATEDAIESKPEPAANSTGNSTAQPAKSEGKVEEPQKDSTVAAVDSTQKAGDEGGELLPKAVHDVSSK